MFIIQYWGKNLQKAFYILHNEVPLKFNFLLTIMIILPLKHFDGLSETEQGFVLPSLQTFVPHC